MTRLLSMTCQVLQSLGTRRRHTSQHSSLHLSRSEDKTKTSVEQIKYHYLITHTSHENKGNGHQRQNILTFKQILASNITNLWRIVSRRYTVEPG